MGKFIAGLFQKGSRQVSIISGLSDENEDVQLHQFIVELLKIRELGATLNEFFTKLNAWQENPIFKIKIGYESGAYALQIPNQKFIVRVTQQLEELGVFSADETEW